MESQVKYWKCRFGPSDKWPLLCLSYHYITPIIVWSNGTSQLANKADFMNGPFDWGVWGLFMVFICTFDLVNLLEDWFLISNTCRFVWIPCLQNDKKSFNGILVTICYNVVESQGVLLAYGSLYDSILQNHKKSFICKRVIIWYNVAECRGDFHLQKRH